MRQAMAGWLLCWLMGGFAVTVQVVSSAQQPEALIIRAKRIYTVTKGIIDNGEILVVGGKIQAVGRNTQAPTNARGYSAEVVIPGMIDAHSHMALDRIGSGVSGPITSEWKARDHFDPKSPMIPVALSGGVTSIITRSGSGIISSGQSVAIKLKSDPNKNMILKPYVDLKMAVRPLGTTRPGQTPATLMGWYATANEEFRLASEYLRAQQDARNGSRTAPPVDERLEAFAAALLTCNVIWYLFPVRYDLRPRIDAGQSAWLRLIRDFYRLDTPAVNCLPSLHVTYAFLTAFALFCIAAGVAVWRVWHELGGARLIGKTIADRAKEKGIKRVVFDRGGYIYHGRVKALADAAREAGLEF